MQDLGIKEFNESVSSFRFSYEEMTRSKNNASSETIAIFLYLPFYKIYRIILNVNSSISILDIIIEQGSIYIYKGQILDNKRSFLEYNVIHETALVVISQRNISLNKEIIEKWLKISEKEIFHQKVKISSNQNNQNEISRIKDIRYMRNEMKRRSFGHTKQSLSNLSSKINIKFDESKLITDYKEQEEPSCEPLPIIWN